MPDFASAFRGQPVLITGGLGFIGSNLARRLVDLGAQVTLIDSLIPQYGGNLFNLSGYQDRLHVNISDIRDEYGINFLVQAQAYIFNLAGQVSHLDSMQNPYTDLEINCLSQLYLLEACRKFNPSARIIYSSTRQIYGKPQYAPVDENHPLAPVDINGVNKLASEWYHILYHRVYGIRTTSLRLTNTYGPRMRVVDARQTFLGLWIRQMIANQEIFVYGDGKQKRDFNYIDDAVEALLLAAVSPKADGEIYNLGAADVISLQELAEEMIELNGSGTFKLVPFPPDRKAIDIGDYYGDYSKIERDLGWKPAIGLRDGLKRTLEYYRAYGEKYW
ncbi:MAG: GDP-mannose 4,6-dehydratase [Anaerolineales bacterium]